VLATFHLAVECPEEGLQLCLYVAHVLCALLVAVLDTRQRVPLVTRRRRVRSVHCTHTCDTHKGTRLVMDHAVLFIKKD